MWRYWEWEKRYLLFKIIQIANTKSTMDLNNGLRGWLLFKLKHCPKIQGSHPLYFDSLKGRDDFSSKILCFKDQSCIEAVYSLPGRIGAVIFIKEK